jgi:hypothetical protein
MDQRNGLDVPQTLEEICRPDRLALLIYDMQVGILGQIADADRVVEKVSRRSRRRAPRAFAPTSPGTSRYPPS